MKISRIGQKFVIENNNGKITITRTLVEVSKTKVEKLVHSNGHEVPSSRSNSVWYPISVWEHGPATIEICKSKRCQDENNQNR